METLHDDHIHPYIEKKLLVRIYIFLFISIALVIYIIREIIIGNIFWLLAIMGVCLGIIAGIIHSKFIGITWHEKKEKVISKLDALGVTVIILFIVVDLSRELIFGRWIHGVDLTIFILCIIAGSLLGKFLGLRSKVMTILKDQDIAEGNPEDVI